MSMSMNVELVIYHKRKGIYPVVKEGVSLSSERGGSPSVLKFEVVKDEVLNFVEGDLVTFVVDGVKMFAGYVFTKDRNKDGTISVTAYDQLRYLKNKDINIFENKTASEIVKMIADDFGINKGDIEDTKFKIASQVEDNSTLFDMIQNAIATTWQNTGEMYVLYDDFGALSLKNISSMKVPIVIDSETAKDFDYSSSIDSNTYNRVRLFYDVEKRKYIEVKDDENIQAWGVLQYTEKIKENETPKAKAESLLKSYNAKTRSLSIKGAFGDARVRAGSYVIVMLNIGDLITSQYMLVQSCTHNFDENEHFMDLKLLGGKFNE